ncbi:hypothetical protein DXX93_18085 [Thalassotalea euphylliae]|uniref:Uncharacterized protein n=1 Tax=Thalassotalea euphylliae TaxID=1655234 RepID=A0A3E0TUZ1_9GAMM|nr:hypothetical protein [Thalassotalea euphylliae]REL28289.1 hypothetical protein DXX93_18085 [Thalassotalea euphylliae]
MNNNEDIYACYCTGLKTKLESKIFNEKLPHAKTHCLLNIVYEIIKECEFAITQMQLYRIAKRENRKFLFLTSYSEYKEFDSIKDYISNIFTSSKFANNIRIEAHDFGCACTASELLDTARKMLIDEESELTTAIIL